jgi:hypothetical protein
MLGAQLKKIAGGSGDFFSASNEVRTRVSANQVARYTNPNHNEHIAYKSSLHQQ